MITERKLRVLSIEDRLAIYKLSLEKNGWKNEMEKSIEELAELIQAILKYRKKQNTSTEFNLIDEITDVYVTCSQISLIFGYEPTTEKPDYMKEDKSHIFFINDISNLISNITKLLAYQNVSFDMIHKWCSVYDEKNDNEEEFLKFQLQKVQRILNYFYPFFEKEIEERIDYKLLKLNDRLK